jgi:hypothetical protein
MYYNLKGKGLCLIDFIIQRKSQSTVNKKSFMETLITCSEISSSNSLTLEEVERLWIPNVVFQVM